MTAAEKRAPAEKTSTTTPTFGLVIPTVGRPSLGVLLEALAQNPPAGEIILVDDRENASSPLLPEGPPAALAERLHVLEGSARGPAAARNVGWRAVQAEWVVFLDDDVVPEPGWAKRLEEDLSILPAEVGGSQGRLRVPLVEDRAPTDWERNVKGLEDSVWISADIAYRRLVLREVGGFDERFRRAYREDADLGLRVTEAGYEIPRGSRSVLHPVRPADRLVSLRLQAGNADDALMRRLHGPDWRTRAHAPPGRFPGHLLVTAGGALGLAAFLLGRRRFGTAGLLLWLAGTAEFAWARISPGPKTEDEVFTMALTSALIPASATFHRLSGTFRAGKSRTAARPRPEAVLFDRDGTLILDVPYNGDPEKVRPVPGARESLDRLRRAGVPLAVVSNQSGVGRGLLSEEEVRAVNRRVEELLGPFDLWLFCPHAPEEGCGCRKPAPGLVLRAARELGVSPARCAVVGDIGPDVEAAKAAGARGILVPTPETLPEEVRRAPEVAPDLASAVENLLGARP